MKKKFGFNAVFAILAFPIGLALIKHTDFTNWTFEKPVLDTFYLIVFIALIVFTFRVNKTETKA